MTRGMLTVGLGTVITVVALIGGAIWTVSMTINTLSNTLAATTATQKSDEVNVDRQFSQVNDSLSRLDSKVTLLLRAQGITSSEVISAK